MSTHTTSGTFRRSHPCVTSTVLGAASARRWLLTPLKSPGSRALHQEIKSYPRICREKPLLFIFQVLAVGTMGKKKVAYLYQNLLVKLLNI